MSAPTLTVIAGCNGSGKSSFANAFSSDGIPSFDYDQIFIAHYNSLKDSELREEIAHNLSRNALEEAIKNAIEKQENFTYETNFNSTPLYWPEKFKTANFNLRLVFFCLNSVDEAKRRVQIRVENGGHFVPDDEITNRYFLGYKHLNELSNFFNEVYLFDTSTYKEKPQFLLSIAENRLKEFANYPDYLRALVPHIGSLIVDDIQ